MQRPSGGVRTRFAPSPTGFLHIGGVRTALYSWLYARRHGGQFLLRIEDTDTERSEDRYTQDILACLKWLGLSWDEEIVVQSERFELYRKKSDELLTQGCAYRCYCTPAEVDAMRDQALRAGKKPMYDRRCRERTQVPPIGTPYVVRAKIPLDGVVEFDDLIHGRIEVSASEIDDFVILRSNGAPTYNFTVVVDDVEMRMTHVIRGDDHLNNTPKQVLLYRFFDYPLPKFAHLSMILGADKKKLSKRHGDVSANYYRGEGYLPETILNFLVRLGWSHGDQEIFSVDEMIRLFDFDHVQKSSAVFNSEKLNWLNGMHLRGASATRLVEIIIRDFSDFFKMADVKRVDTPVGHRLVEFLQPKVKTLRELAEQLVPLCTPGVLSQDWQTLKVFKNPDQRQVMISAVRHGMELLEKKISETQPAPRLHGDAPWGTVPSLGDIGMAPTDVDAFLRQLAQQHGIKMGDLAQPIRAAVTGGRVSAGLFELLCVLPWDLVTVRLNDLIQH